MNEKIIFVKSRVNRQISRLSEEEYKSFKPSGEFIPCSYEKINLQARQGVRWTPFQAICYLSHHDPHDHELQPGSGHIYSHFFLKLKDLVEDAISRRLIILEDSCDVMTGEKVMDAENIFYIRLALESGLNNIPDVFKDFASRQASTSVAHNNKNKLDDKNVVLLNDETISTYETGKKTKKGLRKASEAGAAVNREKAYQFWEPLLDEAMALIKQKPIYYYSASHLAKIIIQKHGSSGINPDTFSKKILSDPEIKSQLKSKSSKNGKSA